MPSPPPPCPPVVTQSNNDISAVKVIHINCNSLVPHVSEIKSLVKSFSPHFIAVSESWCTDRVLDSTIDIEHYVVIRNDRGLINLDSNRDTMGGGIALYLHESLSFSTKSTIRSKVNNVGEIEYLIQKIFTSAKMSLAIAVVYRPPLGDNLDDFFLVLNEVASIHFSLFC